MVPSIRSYLCGSIERYSSIVYEALERGLETRYTNPRRALSTYPRCKSRLKDNSNRVLKYTMCCFIGDRDVIACINLFYRYSRCGGLGVPLNAPKSNADPRLMRGKEMRQ
ncbi:MAG: zinc ribbon domain-containing protein [Ignisphaera sp.]